MSAAGTPDVAISNPFARILDLAPQVIKANPTWVDMSEAFAYVMDLNVENPIAQLELVRFNLDNLDRKISNETARMLGFDLDQDVLDLNANNFTAIVTQLPMYPDQNGTDLFIKFIDLALNALTTVKVKYTRDYVNFSVAPGGPLVINGGDWFKTTHINLSISLFTFETLDLPPGKSLQTRTKELFYGFAPVALVVDQLDFDVLFEDKDWKGGASLGIGVAQPEAEATITIF